MNAAVIGPLRHDATSGSFRGWRHGEHRGTSDRGGAQACPPVRRPVAALQGPADGQRRVAAHLHGGRPGRARVRPAVEGVARQVRPLPQEDGGQGRQGGRENSAGVLPLPVVAGASREAPGEPRQSRRQGAHLYRHLAQQPKTVLSHIVK